MEATFNADNIVILEHTQNNESFKLVKLEDLDLSSKDSINESLSEICKTYNISKENLIIATEESNMILDKSLVSIGKALLSEGYIVSLIPISENHIISKYGEYCLEQAKASGDYEYWIYNQFADFLNESPNIFGNAENLMMKEIELNYDYDKLLNYLLTKAPIQDFSRKQLKIWKDEGLSAKEVVERSTQFPADPYFQAGPFNVGNMHDKKFIKDLEKQNARYKRAYNFVNDPAKLMNSSKAMENEHNFNLAKDRTKKKLHALSKRIGDNSIDVVGVNDDNVDDVQKRIESLNKLIDRETFPKTWLAKKIAWLRGLYKNMMYQCTLQKSNNILVRGLKKLCGIILRTIDKLAIKLQNTVN